ncbi:hypothetical protein HM1_0547 [Heliomicrobium modesticaldum Ice1]|uniref:DUF4367 domain-containing protein n=1 Tax=Heliobacterium modesticaldum (strain ATCC 51547 / Ice1) TaxID=498761 RepID=B0TG04_HELMI|nr:DUF4367 domain-containing protein [Heliomicrobium modesticaldum]ABZ83161.1 hypothetical protein HM1_0547 [Heliomicrobium modesticaldum Ice1]
MNTLSERFLARQIEKTVRKMVTEAPVPPLEESWARLEQKRREQVSAQFRQHRLEKPRVEAPPSEESLLEQPKSKRRLALLYLRRAAVAAAVLVVGGVLSFQGVGFMTTGMRTAGIVGNSALDKASAPAFMVEQSSSAAPPPVAGGATVSESSATVSERSAAVSENSATVSERSAAVSENSATVSERSAAVSENSATVSDSSASVSERSATTSENALAFTGQAAPVTASPEPVEMTPPGRARERVAAAKPSWKDIASFPKEEQPLALALPVPADGAHSNAADTSPVSITSAHNQPGPVVTYLPPGYTLLASKQREQGEPAASTSLRYIGPAPHYFRLTLSAAPLPPEEGEVQAQRDVDIAGAPGKLVLFAKGLLRIEWRRDKTFYTLTGILPEEEAVRIAQSVR